MKQLFRIIPIILCSICVLSCRAQIVQTPADAKKLEINKQQFIGKPFSELEKALKIKIKAFFPSAGNHSNKSKETLCTYYFIIPDGLQDFEHSYIRVYWQTPLNAKESDKIFEKGKGGDWISEAYDFYKNAIIRDLRVR